MMTAVSGFDATAFKSITRAQSDACASGWDDQTPTIRQWLRDPTDAMITMAGIRQGNRVLDVAAGAGDQTIDILQRVGGGGSVLATDLSDGILQLARQNVARAGYTKVTFGASERR